MSAKSKVLIYGCDPVLLETRRWVLEAMRFEVSEATRLEEVERMIAEGQVDVLVLCHSLSAEERRAALRAARNRIPSVKRLLLSAGTEGAEFQGEAEILSIFKGPAALVASVQRATGREGMQAQVGSQAGA